MKKITAVCVSILCAITLFAVTVNPSLDGRAVVAERGVFPSGNYGKAPGYLPGDTVIVTNHSTGFALEVMILSTSDASEGIAIMLSPEAAEKLNIVRGKDVYVKIQKKQAIPFEKVLTASENESGKDIAADPDKNPSKVLESSPELLQFIQDSKKDQELESPKVVEVIPEAPQEPVIEEKTIEESEPLAEDLKIENTVELTDKDTAADTALPIPEDILVQEDEDVIPVLEESELLPPVIEQIDIAQSADTVDEVIPAIEPVINDEQPLVVEETATIEETAPVSDITILSEEAAPVSDITALSEKAAPVSDITDLSEEPDPSSDITELSEGDAVEIAEEVYIPASDIENETKAEEPSIVIHQDLPEEDELIEDDVLELQSEEIIAVENPVEIDTVSVIEEEIPEIIEEPGIVLNESVIDEIPSEPRNIFEEIVNGLGEEIPELVPAEENPPKVTTEDEDVIFITPVETAAVESDIDESKINETAIVTNAKSDEDFSRLVKSADSLAKDTYYIQIATLQEVESITNVVSVYGSKYPMNLIQVDSKYQVLVGPFTDDEYVVIYERFRQKEFKDAFVKKIK